jgi:putative FmdB family regulatory protein
MPLYQYKCTGCHEVTTVRHSMQAVDQVRYCQHCGKPLRRKLTPVHHWWPSNFYPGNEASGQRMILDPEFQAQTKDELARLKESK